MGRDVLIIAHFCSDFDGKGNNRFNYLAELLSENNLEVELVTSSFSHITKTQRKQIQKYNGYKTQLIFEPDYQKNVSFKRMYSHFIMGCNLKHYLERRKKPDIIFCAVPSLDVAKTAALYARKHDVKFIIDIQDLWPEAFGLVETSPIIKRTIFHFIERKADYVYSQADEIFAVSETYAQRALGVSKKCGNAHVVFLGTEIAEFDRLAKEYEVKHKPSNEIWLAYVGTLGHSYDITSTIDALNILRNQGIENIKFIVMGDGPLKSKFVQYAKEKGVHVEFTGRLAYGKMVGILTSCDIAVNPIVCGSAASIINKHADYAAAGLPVINTQDGKEYRELVDEYCTGLNCSNDPSHIAECILDLYRKKGLRLALGKNSRRLAEERFDRSKTYKEMVEVMFKELES